MRHAEMRCGTVRHGAAGNRLATGSGAACARGGLSHWARAARGVGPSPFALGHAPGLPIEPLNLQAGLGAKRSGNGLPKRRVGSMSMDRELVPSSRVIGNKRSARPRSLRSMRSR